SRHPAAPSTAAGEDGHAIGPPPCIGSPLHRACASLDFAHSGASSAPFAVHEYPLSSRSPLSFYTEKAVRSFNKKSCRLNAIILALTSKLLLAPNACDKLKTNCGCGRPKAPR